MVRPQCVHRHKEDVSWSGVVRMLLLSSTAGDTQQAQQDTAKNPHRLEHSGGEHCALADHSESPGFLLPRESLGFLLLICTLFSMCFLIRRKLQMQLKMLNREGE